ncbi:gamma subclass chorismate mutase AroQ [Iodobacter fluviatilis]|uniref:chorismate mutase n=1 Tax=Iodobacter fluviatilis TaxID=537 RepID=A0A377Q7E7_9NEIS|nr:gamma subclass chorismate mutase AroQ [Iodobacter fluviatilis]TCU88743.1 chorismate mutase [Iodobacter fluviatilis]STQ91186.1 Secreted chorismate mutase precursor [Iodobacter fluviatilis]
MRKVLVLLFISLCPMLAAYAQAPVSAPIQSEQTPQVKYLISLMTQRLAVAPLVAQSKWNSGAAINDPAREQAILADVQKQARAIDLDPRFAAAFFQAQFDAGKQIQSQLHQKWRQQKQAPFAPAPDLAKEVRPVLDQLTPQLLMAIKAVQADLCQPEVKHALQTATFGQMDNEVSKMAVSTLQCP